ncbi:hypothetical protein R3P38DRAFT_2704989 [Favolaschia claudopus]|uniref:C2H2-type domain-containing protein n=1 Tax=Favolaschia claudopus TaxID=2862362 RepID=A0AAW0BMP6_9AGAR
MAASTHHAHPIHAHAHAHAHTLPLPSPRPSLGLSTAASSAANSGLSLSSEDASGGEHTARPGNAHHHAAFHAQSLPMPAVLASQRQRPPAALLASSSASYPDTDMDDGMLLTMDPEEDSAPGRHFQTTPTTQQLASALSRPLTQVEADRLAYLDRLKFFLATAPSRWDVDEDGGEHDDCGNPFITPSFRNNSLVLSYLFTHSQTWILTHFTAHLSHYASSSSSSLPSSLSSHSSNNNPYSHPSQTAITPTSHPALNRFLLPSQEYVSCVLWNGLYHITGTDIVRALVFRFEAFSRPVRNMKKFEEGVFSDLRNLKPGADACLEEPKSPFLDLLFKYQCIRTQKKQKVFYWFSVPHDRLFLDALERDLKREKMGLEPTTQITGEPALSFKYDGKKSLYEQFVLNRGMSKPDDDNSPAGSRNASVSSHASHDDSSSVPTPFMAMFGLFEGSPTYKQRRKKSGKPSGLGPHGAADEEERRGRPPGRYVPGPGEEEMMAGATAGLSAAEMFIKQARGELGPGGSQRSYGGPYGAQNAHQQHVQQLAHHQEMLAAFQAQQHHPVMQQQPQQQQQHPGAGQRQRSHEETMREAYAANQQQAAAAAAAAQAQAQQHSPGFAQTGFAQPSNAGTPFAPNAGTNGGAPGEMKTKVFACPLFSCGRMFKRMEHLRRHLRTHTMERPFVCPKCNKRFSRSDNLNQHVRTHQRADGLGVGSEWTGAGATSGEEDESGGEGEEIDELAGDDSIGGPSGIGVTLGMFGGPSGVGLGMGMGGGMGGVGAGGTSRLSADMSYGGQQLDVQMCEVEVQGDVQEVIGDEEGLMMRSGPPAQQGENSFFPAAHPTGAGGPYGSNHSSSEFVNNISGEQWAAIRSSNSGSPAYSSMSVPSPPPPVQRATLPNAPTPFSRHHSSGSNGSMYEEYVTSISAPSHKQAFDHASLYPPGLLENLSTGGGAVRRHRSMTPSVVRNGEPIRRPLTSNSGEFPGVGASPSSRGYHPYAYGSASGSRAGSTHSSPSYHNIPLAPEFRRSDSRNSNLSASGSGGSGLNEQMRQMMTMGGSSGADADAQYVTAPGYPGGQEMFRSDSPGPAAFTSSPQPFTSSPGLYSTDLPGGGTQYETYAGAHQHHAQTVPAQFDKQGLYAEYAPAAGGVGGDYYATHPQHVSTI